MQAVQGTYSNGILTLNEKAPKNIANVIVIFTEEPLIEDSGMSTEEALRIVKKYSGCIKEEIDINAERLVYLDERYGSAN